MTARKYRSYDVDYLHPEIEVEQQQQYPLYQDYIPEAESNPNLKELLFFVNIATFCILTALFSFIFLSFKFNTFLAFGLAIVASLVFIKIQQTLIKLSKKK